MSDRKFRLAIIGCGTITERAHLPAAARLKDAEVTLLVDRDRTRAEALARRYRVPHISEDYRAAWDKADGAIVALPHNLHAPVTIDLLQHQVHVLVEKPMALNVSECNAMRSAGEAAKAVLAVGLMRRFAHGARWTKAVLDAGVLGPIQSFNAQLGSAIDMIRNWPAPPRYVFQKEINGGGVLIEGGVHILDLLLWWLGDVAAFEYYDDYFGGEEADCRLHLTFVSGARGVVEVSRTRNLANAAVLRGTKGAVRVPIYNNRISGRPKEILAFKLGDWTGRNLPRQPVHEPFRLQILDWLDAIRSGSEPLVSAAEGTRTIALVEACYGQRRTWELPWLRPGKAGALKAGGG